MEKQKAKELIIIGLDANEIILPPQETATPTSISNLVREYGLIDVYAHMHGTVGDTSIKKSHKIDHLLVSSETPPSLQRLGFLPWNQVIESDHRAGFADFDASKLFGEEPQDAMNYG